MIKAESKIVDAENCKLEMEVKGGLKDVELEGIIIVKGLISNISVSTGIKQKAVLSHFIKRLTEQFEGI